MVTSATNRQSELVDKTHDCPVWQEGWPEGENNETIVLCISDCGQTDLAGKIWILYGATPSHCGLFVFLRVGLLDMWE